MSLKLYCPVGNPRGGKVLVAADLANVQVDTVDITYEAMKKEDHRRRHPLGKVPVLETPEGYIYESNAILRYVARLNSQAKLYGENQYESALVDQWLDFVSTEVEPIFTSLIIPVLGYYPLDGQSALRAHQDLIARFQVFDAHLKANNFLVGTHLTIADVQLAYLVTGAFRFIVDENIRKTLPNLVRWFDYVAYLPPFLNHFGRPRNCKVPFPALQITHVQQEAPKQQEKKQQPPKEEKKKQPQQEKKEKPAPAPAPVQKKEEEEEEAPKKKEANPLDLLPASQFNIDDWKRQFLAAKDAESMKAQFDWFWQNLDENGYSVWEVLYEKAEGEGKQLLKTSNTMKGFIQRTEQSFRKYAFAIHGVYGEEPDLEIRGAWLWRGVEIPNEMREHPSFEFHKFNKLSKVNENDRKLFEEYWLNQTEDESVVKGLRLRTSVYFR